MDVSGPERRLAAVVAADMVGYSRLMEADETGTLARLKTHRIELIDPSILRPGRFGVHIHVSLPDAEGRAAIVRIGFKGSKFEHAAEIDRIVDRMVPLTEGFSGAEIRHICDDAKRIAIKAGGFTKALPPTLSDVLEALEAWRSARTEGGNVNG